MQIIFSFWSFEISDGVLNVLINQKIIIGLDSFLAPFGPIWIISTTLLKVAKLQLLSLATCCKIYRTWVTEEASLAETAIWFIPFLISLLLKDLF